MNKKIIVYDGYTPSKEPDGREFLKLKLEPLLTNLRCREWKDKDCPPEIQEPFSTKFCKKFKEHICI